MIEIKPCPHCGEKPYIYRCPSMGVWSNPYFLVCQNNNCKSLGVELSFFCSFKYLIKAWNYFCENKCFNEKIKDEDYDAIEYLPSNEYLDYKNSLDYITLK